MRSVSSGPHEGLRLAVSEKPVRKWGWNILSFNIRFHFNIRPLLKSNFHATRQLMGGIYFNDFWGAHRCCKLLPLLWGTSAVPWEDPFHYAVTPPSPSSHPCPVPLSLLWISPLETSDTFKAIIEYGNYTFYFTKPKLRTKYSCFYYTVLGMRKVSDTELYVKAIRSYLC